MKMYHPETAQEIDVDVHQMAIMAEAGYVHAVEDVKKVVEKVKAAVKGSGLKKDGPTIEEFVKAGYLASGYPPEGYEPRSTPEEIAAAVAVEKAAKA